jgi:hypothetical protein
VTRKKPIHEKKFEKSRRHVLVRRPSTQIVISGQNLFYNYLNPFINHNMFTNFYVISQTVSLLFSFLPAECIINNYANKKIALELSVLK